MKKSPLFTLFFVTSSLLAMEGGDYYDQLLQQHKIKTQLREERSDEGHHKYRKFQSLNLEALQLEEANEELESEINITLAEINELNQEVQILTQQIDDLEKKMKCELKETESE